MQYKVTLSDIKLHIWATNLPLCNIKSHFTGLGQKKPCPILNIWVTSLLTSINQNVHASNNFCFFLSYYFSTPFDYFFLTHQSHPQEPCYLHGFPPGQITGPLARHPPSTPPCPLMRKTCPHSPGINILLSPSLHCYLSKQQLCWIVIFCALYLIKSLFLPLLLPAAPLLLKMLR